MRKGLDLHDRPLRAERTNLWCFRLQPLAHPGWQSGASPTDDQQFLLPARAYSYGRCRLGFGHQPHAHGRHLRTGFGPI